MAPYLSGMLSSKVQKRVNYHNVDDDALGKWEINNAYKPDGGYGFGYRYKPSARPVRCTAFRRVAPCLICLSLEDQHGTAGLDVQRA
jgi:hypothetical protein